jgi:hypothetical protein
VANDDVTFHGGHVAIVHGKVDLSNVAFTNLKTQALKAIAILDDGEPGKDSKYGYLGSLVTCSAPVYFCPQFQGIEEVPSAFGPYQSFDNTNCDTVGDMTNETQAQCYRWFNSF